jgi:hypothetical protein
MKDEAPSRFELAFERRRLLAAKRVFDLKMRLRGDYHPSSYPFISGDGFRALARFRFDTIDDIEAFTKRSDAEATRSKKSGDIVFVASPIIKEFFERAHPRVSEPYILITHNGDTNIDESFLKFIDDRIIRWFAQNVLAEHPKLTPIPIGLEDLHYYQNGIVSHFKSMRRRIKMRPFKGRLPAENGRARKARIFYHFKVRTNSNERQPALDYFNRHPLAETMENKLSPRLYLKKLSSYMFTASPPGNGDDCHRTWEAMYLGVIPIVRRSTGTDYLKGLGLPMLVVDEWADLDGFDENKLKGIYEKTLRESRTEALYMDHWIREIKTAAD